MTRILPSLPERTVFTSFFVPAVLVSAWYAGLFSGIAATLLGSAYMAYFVLRPVYSFNVESAEDLARILAFGIVGVCLSFVVTSQRRTRDLSLENTERLRTTLASIGDAVIVTDDRCEVTMINEAGSRLTGWTAADAIGRPIAVVFHIVDEVQRLDVLRVDIRRHEISSMRLPDHVTLISREGAEYPIHATIAPIQAGTESHGVVVVFRDVTAERRYQQRVESARDELQETNRVKDQFLAMVSHELRTPLTSIVGWAALIRQKRLEGATLEMALNTIERNAKVQIQLVEDLLDISRIEAGTFRLDRTLVHSDAVITNAIDALRASIDDKHIQLTFKAQSCPAMYLDANRFQQVLWNLLSNAIKFTPANGRIDVEAHVNGHMLEITIQDNGRGFPPEFRDRLFERFQQSDPGNSRHGLGLGLSIVRHIVELHGGMVDGHSNGIHKGATFTVRVPIVSQSQLPAGAATNVM